MLLELVLDALQGDRGRGFPGLMGCVRCSFGTGDYGLFERWTRENWVAGLDQGQGVCPDDLRAYYGDNGQTQAQSPWS